MGLEARIEAGKRGSKMHANSKPNATVKIRAKVTRADGSVEDLGVISEQKVNMARPPVVPSIPTVWGDK